MNAAPGRCRRASSKNFLIKLPARRKLASDSIKTSDKSRWSAFGQTRPFCAEPILAFSRGHPRLWKRPFVHLLRKSMLTADVERDRDAILNGWRHLRSDGLNKERHRHAVEVLLRARHEQQSVDRVVLNAADGEQPVHSAGQERRAGLPQLLLRIPM